LKADYSNNKILIEHLTKGDEKAFAYLMDTYHHRLCVYANSLCRDKDLAKDIAQNILVRIWEQRKKLKDSLSLKSYLYKSVYNEFIDQYRKKKTLLALEENYIKTLSILLKEEDTGELHKLIALVQQEIDSLPPKCKEIFIMGKQEGLTYAEIAEHLNISFRTVENQMSKAYLIIRKKLGDKTHAINILIFACFKLNKHSNTSSKSN
jgi:RNA polymerase sigma-70 factor (family 1)